MALLGHNVNKMHKNLNKEDENVDTNLELMYD